MFTIFTATYNRARLLPRVYESLRCQTCTDFEWVIVDDGSTDGTRELVRQWQGQGDLRLRYLWQEHAGKHVAFNRGVRAARGECFLSIDSDDECVPHALERFAHHWKAIPKAERNRYCGVTGLCLDEDGCLIGTGYPAAVFDSTSLEARYRYRVKGDKWGFQRTDLLRAHPFPEIPGVAYIPEGIVWSALSAYKTRFINEALLICWAGRRAAADRLSSAGNPAQYAPGLRLWHLVKLNSELTWFWWAPDRFFVSAAHYVRFSLHVGVLRGQLTGLPNPWARLLWLLGLPVGVALYLADRCRAP